MSNHPNRSKKAPSAAANPKPEEILEARLAADLTQKEAGELVHGSERTWQDWERGERRMYASDWELFRIKAKARKLVAQGKIAATLVKQLGISLPPAPPAD